MTTPDCVSAALVVLQRQTAVLLALASDMPLFRRHRDLATNARAVHAALLGLAPYNGGDGGVEDAWVAATHEFVEQHRLKQRLRLDSNMILGQLEWARRRLCLGTAALLLALMGTTVTTIRQQALQQALPKKLPTILQFVDDFLRFWTHRVCAWTVDMWCDVTPEDFLLLHSACVHLANMAS
jgi:hypothetical protein